MGADPVESVPTLQAACSAKLKKMPGRTEFQRGILTRAPDGSLTVRPTGEQGSGILKSMSDANCFIILGDRTGNVEPGTMVEVQLLEGIV
jgi:molybdopterin molybdotransferase